MALEWAHFPPLSRPDSDAPVRTSADLRLATSRGRSDYCNPDTSSEQMTLIGKRIVSLLSCYNTERLRDHAVAMQSAEAAEMVARGTGQWRFEPGF